jgi:hypothetical protein
MLDLSNLLACPACAAEFMPKRTNQKYCTPSCQKASTRNTSRGSRVSETKGRSAYHYERAMRLAEMLYTAPPQERLGVMQHILLRAHPNKDNRPFFRGRDKTFPQAANKYTKKFFGVSVAHYLKQAREGCLNEKHEVAPAEQPKTYVPCLKPMRNVKCWHKPLSAEGQALAEMQAASDYARVAEIVETAQERVNAYQGPIHEQPSDAPQGALKSCPAHPVNTTTGLLPTCNTSTISARSSSPSTAATPPATSRLA